MQDSNIQNIFQAPAVSKQKQKYVPLEMTKRMVMYPELWD